MALCDELLEAALESCDYIEDVRALRHFVFHSRMNHCSNVCIVCHVAECDECACCRLELADTYVRWRDDHELHMAGLPFPRHAQTC